MILVTGGTGFVGSNLIAGLEAREHRGIAVCDRLGAGARWRNLAGRAVGTVFPPERLSGFLDEGGGAVEAVYHIGLHDGGRDVDGMLETIRRKPRWSGCGMRDTTRAFFPSRMVSVAISGITSPAPSRIRKPG